VRRAAAAPPRRRARVAGVAALLAGLAALPPGPAAAEGLRGGPRGFLGPPPLRSWGTLGGGAFRPDLSPPPPVPAHKRDDGRRAHRHRPQSFVSFGYPLVVAPAYAVPDYAYPPEPPTVVNIAPVFYNAPAYQGAPPAYAPVAEPPAYARPTVVEYPTGRHELRGDGITSPHVWVWIPNPPPPPAAAAAPAPEAPAGAAPAPARSRLYRWVDAQGTVHLTNSPEAVPERERAPAARPAP
jgi:hypothetical protein